MKEFTSFADFAVHCVGMVATVEAAQASGMDRATAHLQAKAKGKLGTYQPEAQTFAAWAELAESTKERREKAGFTPNDPLLMTGDMRDSIERQHTSIEGVVGSNSDIAVYQELGTAKIPPRSFFGSTGVEEAGRVVQILGAATALALAGEDVHNGRIELLTGN